MNLSRFESWYDMVPEGESYTSEVMAEYAAQRFHETVAENPYFYYGPFTGMIARNAGYLFITRLFANHSSEHPEGVLSKCSFADHRAPRALDRWDRADSREST